MEIAATDYHTTGEPFRIDVGAHRFYLDRRDPLGTGFVLR
jgi:hypothetical protein